MSAPTTSRTGQGPSSRTFEYTVRDAQGKTTKGRIEASNQAAVATRLRGMGVAPIDIVEVPTSGLQREIHIPGLTDRVGLKDLAIMARQMATMVSAGLSLLRTLNVLTEQTENRALAKTLGQARGDVESGMSLSVALAKHPDVFPPLMVNIVRAGETGGFLENSLLSLAENYEAEVKLRSKVKSAMTYPVIVFILAILAVVGMLIFIVPVFEQMFTDLGGELPWVTQLLVNLSGVMAWLAPVLLLVVLAVGVWWRLHRNDDAVRSKVDPIKLRLPVFGKLSTKIALARFSRNFSSMISAGVPLLQALEIVGATSNNWVIERALREVRESVRKGESLSGPLAQNRVFPAMVVQMVAIGEDAGSLEIMLTKIAEFYDQEVEATTEQLTSLVEPLMIVLLGGLIGGMIIALYLPMFSIFQYIQ